MGADWKWSKFVKCNIAVGIMDFLCIQHCFLNVRYIQCNVIHIQYRPCFGVLVFWCRVETKVEAFWAAAAGGANSSPVISHHLPQNPRTPNLVNLERVLPTSDTQPSNAWPAAKWMLAAAQNSLNEKTLSFSAKASGPQSYFIHPFVLCIKLKMPPSIFSQENLAFLKAQYHGLIFLICYVRAYFNVSVTASDVDLWTWIPNW